MRQKKSASSNSMRISFFYNKKNMLRSANSKRASTLVMIIFISSIIFILSMMMMSIVVQDKKTSVKVKDVIQMKYYAEFGIALMKRQFIEQAKLPLFTADKIFKDKLALLDFENAASFTKTIKYTPPGSGIKINVTLEIMNIRATPFNCYLHHKEKSPIRLNIFKKKNDDSSSENKTLGGWDAFMKIVSTAKSNKEEQTVESLFNVKMNNLTPPAPEYTFFIHGQKVEDIKEGQFILSNWDFQGTVGKVVVPLMKKMSEELSLNFDEMEFNDLLQNVKGFVQSVDSYAILNKINQIIMNLSPWGKVRCNGRLNVYLPFFEVDDIINYFVDEESLEFPEIGYIGFGNRLHDRFMGKYTRYEGKIYKYYYELKPYIFSKQRKTARHALYTMFSTMKNYPLTHKNEVMPEYFENIVTNAKKYCTRKLSGEQKFFGTDAHPIFINGIIYTDGDIYVGGNYRGRGMLFTSKGDIHITEDLIPVESTIDMLGLIAPEGKLILHKLASKTKINAAISVKNSILKGKAVEIRGNLISENLNRHGLDEGIFKLSAMPKKVMITYDSRLRNRAANNVYPSISVQTFYYRF